MRSEGVRIRPPVGLEAAPNRSPSMANEVDGDLWRVPMSPSLSPDDRLARLERRVEQLEERFADVLAALAHQWTSFSDAAKAQAGRVAQAATARSPPKQPDEDSAPR